ncbi:MAG TPA: hypothetical protein VEX63_03815, partial [Flavisolibacter sp.]|nr:hypothetical protein [Flavisolibacter sp.]
MKKNFTLLILIFFSFLSKAQIVINEVYPIPGSGRHEFFELYNNSPSSLPASMDDYTLVTYFEEAGNVKGYYVIDLPALNVVSKGYFIGAAAAPFNHQGITNATANFSWNDAAFLAANNGFLKKWIVGNNVPAATDGNAFYDEAPIPANFNDIFVKIGGGSASYHIFLFKSGNLMNAFLGGSSSTTMPAYILSMPSLFVDMAGTTPDYTVNFSSFNNAVLESVIPEVGTDNGYIRTRDGFCGAWVKSSAQVNHTPGATNGQGDVPVGVISVSAATTSGTPTTGSTVNYDVVGAPSYAFPITMHIYTDNGSNSNNLDGTDVYVASNIENVLSDGGFSTVFQPHNANILVVTTSSAGCIDNIRFIPTVGVLPVQLQHFTGRKQNGKVQL